MKSKLVATKLSPEEYKRVVEYARRRKVSTYQAVRELIKLGLLRECFIHELWLLDVTRTYKQKACRQGHKRNKHLNVH
ncbi:MAG: hypothetical protein J7J99_01735 [Thermoprotei archaeon]|nr:hypothetical protein [Thermoprotei archaeon]